MDLPTTATAEDLASSRGFRGHFADNPRSLSSAVSWGAIAAGAAAAASLSLILLILGVGLGLSSVSHGPETVSVRRPSVCPPSCG